MKDCAIGYPMLWARVHTNPGLKQASAALNVFLTGEPSPMDAVRRMIHEDFDFAWVANAVGLVKFGIGMFGYRGTSVHVWHRRFAWCPHLAHAHPFPMHSRIVQGVMRNRTFDAADATDSPTHLRVVLGVGETNRIVRRSGATLIERPTESYAPGEDYRLPTTVPHIADPDDGTITVVHKAAYTSQAEVFLEKDHQNVDDLRKFLSWHQATPNEIALAREIIG